MKQSFLHLIFFDSTCSICQRSVRHLLDIDRDKIFCFAPLLGKTFEACFEKEKVKHLSKLNSMILIENFQEKKNSRMWIRAKAVFRIFWLLGKKWTLIGWMFCLPGFLLDWIYNFVAKHRHRLTCKKPSSSLFEGVEKSRFLP